MQMSSATSPVESISEVDLRSKFLFEGCYQFVTGQHQALRWTFLGSGMTHPNFLSTLERLSPALRKRLEQVAPVFC